MKALLQRAEKTSVMQTTSLTRVSFCDRSAKCFAKVEVVVSSCL